MHPFPRTLLLAALLQACAASTAVATSVPADASPAARLPLPQRLDLFVGDSRVIAARTTRIAVGNGKVLAVSPVSAGQLVLIGQSPGSTVLQLWLRDGSQHRKRPGHLWRVFPGVAGESPLRCLASLVLRTMPIPYPGDVLVVPPSDDATGGGTTECPGSSGEHLSAGPAGPVVCHTGDHRPDGCRREETGRSCFSDQGRLSVPDKSP